MTFTGVMMILWYALPPWIWLLVLLLATLILSYGFGRHNLVKARKILWLLSAIAGLTAMVLAPSLTHSQLSYVTTWPDKITLAAIGVAVTCYVALLLTPWFKRALCTEKSGTSRR